MEETLPPRIFAVAILFVQAHHSDVLLMRYNTSVMKALKHKKDVAAVFFIVALIGVVGYGSYSYGYNEGAGNVAKAPLNRLTNIDSSGEIALIVDDAATKTDFADFWRTWNILEKNFAPTATGTSATSSEQARVAGAIAGLAASYQDPYTVFLPKENADDFKEQVNGEFEGIGAGLDITTADGVVVIGTLPNSPAEKAGLKAGDRVIAVDGDPTLGKKLEDVIPHIRGPKGTTVTLTIGRAKSTKVEDIALTRGTVVIPSTATRVVSAAKSVVAAAVAKATAAAAAALPGSKERAEAEAQIKAAQTQQFFVLQLATFTKTSIDAFVTDLGRFAKTDTSNLIIDLRNNPGGYLDVANDLASYFLPKDVLVVTEKTGAAQVPTEYRSKGYDTLSSIDPEKRRIVVLLNRNSASASEILAGALQDYGAAKVVGEQSFGKGSVQTIIDIGQLGTLKITIARWYTPKGNNISHTGITPDISVDLKDPKYASSTDPFMDAAVETILDDSQWK